LWSEWSPATKKEYTGLHEGNYTFRVRARNIYGIIGKESSFQFTILTPWFRSWWAYVLYALAFLLLISLILQLNQRRLISETKALSRKVDDRTKEIIRQKELVEKEKENVEKKTQELENTLETLKQTQSQLIQTEKMASLGQLTAGIAHEINNPINFVTSSVNPLKRNFNDVKKLLESYDHLLSESDKKNSAALLRKDLDMEQNLSESENLLKGIEEGSRRTAEIIKGLRNFSRLDTEEIKKVNINEGIESTLPLLQNKLTHQNIEVIKSFGNIHQIDGYPGQLNQVFMNLFTNAIDAIGSNGKIFITTTTENNFVKISFRDTGTGMSEEVKEKIFDPFFTTKLGQGGSGLGLSISYNIVTSLLGGHISVISSSGGTTFTLDLPLTAPRHDPARPATIY
jgi:signal transduction histidine kinase